MNNKWTRIIVIVLIALVVIAVVVRLLFWQALLNILSGEFLALSIGQTATYALRRIGLMAGIA